jgi:prepilin-type N-terminal cleavage/methylation domain-containing protein
MKKKGFSLIEVIIAIGILGFCIIPMIGLIPVSLDMVRDTVKRTEAVGILGEVNVDLKCTASDATSSPIYGITFPSGTTPSMSTIYVNELGVVVPLRDAKFGVSVILINPSTVSTSASVRVWWPPTAPSTGGYGMQEGFTTILRN